MRKPITLLLAAVASMTMLVPAYTAYKGHADDRDVNAVLTTYPALKGTPADSCEICHRRGTVRDAGHVGRERAENHCDYCHAVFARDGHPVQQTLNQYGLAYSNAGRNAAAVRALAVKDSDGDGVTNEAELMGGTNPGEAASHPGVKVAPARTYSITQLRALSPAIEHTIFLNTTKSRSGDSYSAYRGNAVWGVLQGIGMADTATSVDVLSADGYERTFTMEELKRTWSLGPPVLGLGTAELGSCGWVRYNVAGLDPAKPLPPAPILLAFEENGVALPKAVMDASTGRLVGQGPMRVVVPQFEGSPPDQSQKADPGCAGKVPEASRFHEAYDHNGGKSSFAIVAIRVNPLPPGTRDADWQSGASSRLAKDEVLVFGSLR